MNQTVTLDQAKAIEVAKIIENEKALRIIVDDLMRHINILNDSIQNYAARVAYGADRIKQLTDSNDQIFKEVLRLRDELIKPEPDKSRGIYLYNSIGGNTQQLTQLSIGLALVKNKTLYSVTVDPILNPTPVVFAGIGWKLF